MQISWPSLHMPNTDFRSTANKRFSQFFHGTSYLGSYGSKNHRSRKGSRIRSQILPLRSRVQRNSLDQNPSGSRSPTSIRSIIDPTSSPSSSSRPPPAVVFGPIQSNSASTVQLQDWERNAIHRSEARARQRPEMDRRYYLHWPSRSSCKKGWLSNIKDKTVRKWVITCIVFGAILALMFIICEFYDPLFK